MANAGKTARGRFTRTKRSTSTRDCEEAEELQLGRLFSERMALVPTAFQFNCDHPAEKERLAQMLWRSDLLVGPETPTLRSANTDFVQLMLLLTANTYKEVSEGKDAMWQEGILSTLTRIQSQKVTTLVTARVSIEALRAQVQRDFFQLLHQLAPGILASHSWTEEFIKFACQFRPPPAYEELLGVGCVMFDNYTRKVLYSSTHTTDSWGFRLDMTNSCTMRIPRHLAPSNFDAKEICE